MKRLFLAMLIGEVTMNAQPGGPVAGFDFTLEGDHVVIGASVNGHAGRFALDTGSAAMALSSAFADGAGLTMSDRPASISGAGAERAPIRMGVAGEVTIGRLSLSSVRTVILPETTLKAAGRELDGTLGYDVFAKWTVAIDFAKRRLLFFDPAGWSPAAGAVNVPVDVSRRIPLMTVEVKARKDSAPVQAKLMVDTGTPVFPVTLSSAFAARAGIDRIQSRQDVVIGLGASGISMGAVLRVAEVKVQQLSLSDIFVAVSSDTRGFYASGIADGTLGQPVFQRTTVTVDYAHHQISLEPGAEMSKGWKYPDRCGWTIGKDTVTLRVFLPFRARYFSN